jgi:hypothetical protein
VPVKVKVRDQKRLWRSLAKIISEYFYGCLSSIHVRFYVFEFKWMTFSNILLWMPFATGMFYGCYVVSYNVGWDLIERSEWCANMQKVAGSNPSCGSKSIFRSDLLLTARGSSTRALIVVACLLCYPGNTLCSQCIEPPTRVG